MNWVNHCQSQEGAGDYFLIVVVDLERGLRVSVFVVLACGDAGCRCEFH